MMRCMVFEFDARDAAHTMNIKQGAHKGNGIYWERFVHLTNQCGMNSYTANRRTEQEQKRTNVNNNKSEN